MMSNFCRASSFRKGIKQFEILNFLLLPQIDKQVTEGKSGFRNYKFPFSHMFPSNWIFLFQHLHLPYVQWCHLEINEEICCSEVLHSTIKATKHAVLGLEILPVRYGMHRPVFVLDIHLQSSKMNDFINVDFNLFCTYTYFVQDDDA